MTVFAHISLCSFSGNAALLSCVHDVLPGARHGRISPRRNLLWVCLCRGSQGSRATNDQWLRTNGFGPCRARSCAPQKGFPSGRSCRHCPAPKNSCFLQIEFMFAPSIPLPFLPGNSHGPVDLVRVHEPARPLLPLPRTALCGVRGNGQARGHLAHVPGGQEIQRPCSAHLTSA